MPAFRPRPQHGARATSLGRPAAAVSDSAAFGAQVAAASNAASVGGALIDIDIDISDIRDRIDAAGIP